MTEHIYKPSPNTDHIKAVNYHMLEQCNMRCSHCFVTEISTSPKINTDHKMQQGHAKSYLPLQEAKKMIEMLSDEGFEKINFAGGEPMLYPGLDELIREAKKTGMITSMVTNGTGINQRWLDSIKGHLDWIALSIDSARAETHRISGRMTSAGPTSTEEYLRRDKMIRERDIRLKINTVVTCHNWEEDMTEFIISAMPERWKIMQALPIKGQNDKGGFAITKDQFFKFLEQNKTVEEKGIKVIPEENDLMTGSYVMISPLGQFFDNVDGRYKFSRPIIQAGIKAALDDVRLDYGKFKRRGGNYDW